MRGGRLRMWNFRSAIWLHGHIRLRMVNVASRPKIRPRNEQKVSKIKLKQILRDRHSFAHGSLFILYWKNRNCMDSDQVSAFCNSAAFLSTDWANYFQNNSNWEQLLVVYSRNVSFVQKSTKKFSFRIFFLLHKQCKYFCFAICFAKNIFSPEVLCAANIILHSMSRLSYILKTIFEFCVNLMKHLFLFYESIVQYCKWFRSNAKIGLLKNGNLDFCRNYKTDFRGTVRMDFCENAKMDFRKMRKRKFYVLILGSEADDTIL